MRMPWIGKRPKILSTPPPNASLEQVTDWVLTIVGLGQPSVTRP